MKRSIITTAALVVLTVVALTSAGEAAKPAPGTLTITADHANVKFGAGVTLSGKLGGSNVSGRTVRVQEDVYPLSAFGNTGSATTNATGDWSLAVKPTANTRYRANSGKVDSPTVDVMVHPAITLRLSDRTPEARAAGPLLGPAVPRARLSRDRAAAEDQLRLEEGREPRAGRHPRRTCSKYSVMKRVRRSGSYRAHFNADADHAAGNSPRRRASGPLAGRRSARRPGGPQAARGPAASPGRGSLRRFGRRVRAAA